jgi:hypothetical protein
MISLLVTFIAFISVVNGGPVVVGLCYTACNAAVVSCYASSGLVFGAIGPVGWMAWLTSAAATCSLAQGACMAACTTLAIAPTI